MKISEHQLIMLLQILKDSFTYMNTYNEETRKELFDEIINQQSSIIREVE